MRHRPVKGFALAAFLGIVYFPVRLPVNQQVPNASLIPRMRAVERGILVLDALEMSLK